jgi:hypothetical protein
LSKAMCSLLAMSASGGEPANPERNASPRQPSHSRRFPIIAFMEWTGSDLQLE